MKLPWKIAAPSFVWPARVGENCLHLQHLVQEVGITFFETAGSLDYNKQDLPPWLTQLGLDFHLHLPLDLPWEQGGELVFELCRRLLQKTDYLQPQRYVLHPPLDQEQLQVFFELWTKDKNSSSLLLENIQGNDLTQLWPWILDKGLGVCLDLGHLLLFEQEALLQVPELWSRVHMLHIYGEQQGHRHSALDQLSPRGQAILYHLLQHISRDCTLVLEVFNPKNLQTSLDIFAAWITNWGLQQG